MDDTTTRQSPLEPTGLNRLWVRFWVYYSYNLIMDRLGMKKINGEEFEELWEESFCINEQKYAIEQGWA